MRRRTFKRSKHIKRRPYHKRSSLLSLRFAKSTLIGLIPLIIIGIGLMTSFLISYKVLDRYNNMQISIPLPKYSIPKINYQEKVIGKTFQELIQIISSFLSRVKFSLPSISIPTFEIHIPKLDFSQFIEYPQYLLQQTIVFLTLLNPLPLLQRIGQSIMYVTLSEGRIFTNNGIQTVKILSTIALAIITIAKEILLGLYWMISSIIIMANKSVQVGINTMMHLYLQGISQIKTTIYSISSLLTIFVIYILNVIAATIIFIWEKATYLLNTLWKIILIPFITVHKQLMTFSPFINAFTEKIRTAAEDLLQSCSDIISFLTTTIKGTSH